jgi:hypothetical protein
LIKTKAFQLRILSRTLNSKHRVTIDLSLDGNLDASKSFCFIVIVSLFCFIVIVSLLLFSLLLFHCYCLSKHLFSDIAAPHPGDAAPPLGAPPPLGAALLLGAAPAGTGFICFVLLNS